jgi:hypothetical protein
METNPPRNPYPTDVSEEAWAFSCLMLYRDSPWPLNVHNTLQGDPKRNAPGLNDEAERSCAYFRQKRRWTMPLELETDST